MRVAPAVVLPLLLLACRPPASAPAIAQVAPSRAAPAPATAVAPSPARHGTATATCGGNGIAALQFAPAAADSVAHVDLGALMRVPALAPVRSVLERAPDVAALVGAAAECGLGPDTWRGLTTARAEGSVDSITVLQAEGIGERERLGCVRDAMVRAKQEPRFALAPGDGAVELELVGDGGRAIAVDRCTLVIASPRWIDATRERIAGRGRSLLEGPLMPTILRAGEGRAVWMAVRSASSTTLAFTGNRADDLAASVSVHDGFAVDVSLQFATPETARAAADQVSGVFNNVKSMMVTMGLPQTVVDGTRITAAGAFVSVAMRGSVADLEILSRAIAKTASGVQ